MRSVEPVAKPGCANRFAIPGTGKRHGGHCSRRPRNIGVKRALLAAVGTLKGIAVPPNGWDDIHISAIRHRTWKRHRTTQWRGQAA